MKNKKLKNREIKPQEYQNFRGGKRTSNVHAPFDIDSIENSGYPWWEKLVMKMVLPHKNKLIDRVVDIGCLLTILIMVGTIIFIAIWIFNLLQKVIC